MPTRVRSFSKINLGLAIGPARPDGFHPLTTLYQTIEAHDVLTVSVETLAPGEAGRIVITSNERRVPLDSRNTVWKMLEQALALEPFCSRSYAVGVHLEKRLPIQGGLGAGSANAAAALVGLERETGLALPGGERLRIAEQVGSDVPLFLIGGAVLGLGRGEQVYPLPDLVETREAVHAPVVVLALPNLGVSTPQAFRDWDALGAGSTSVGAVRSPAGGGIVDTAGLTLEATSPTLEELSRALAGIFCEPHYSSGVLSSQKREGLARHPLSALVRTGIRNDFEDVVLRQHPFLGTIKRALLGSSGRPDGKFSSEPALATAVSTGVLYAALSGSGSALFGLYANRQAASAAEARVHAVGVRTLRTRLLSRAMYWERMLEQGEARSGEQNVHE